jgi:hemoglobin-like flavoprotein
MPDTETLTRGVPMSTEPDIDENARYSDPDPEPEPEPEPEPPVATGPIRFEDKRARDLCPHCRGTGYALTKNDLLRESIGLLGDAGDEVMRLFYANLLEVAPELRPLFPLDLTEPGSLGAGRIQRDKLLGALVAVSQTYDPDRPDQMQILDNHLKSFGNSHAAFDRGDGRVQGATLAEYTAVKVVLFNTLHDVAGEAWRSEYDDVWSEAYDYAAGAMLFHGMRSGFKSARYARP